jgi:TM2 domain-containing membrane protein YozV
MKRMINNRSGIRAVITGLVLLAVGYIVSLIDVFNVYGKADATSPCWHAPDSCSLASNLLVAHIGEAITYTGYGAVGVGVIVLIISSRRDK